MDEQERQFEDEPDVAGKNKKKPREAGHGEDGEPSLEALRVWLIWAGAALIVCLAVACILAAVSSGQNKKAVFIMEAEGESALEFVLNRKGMVLETSDGALADWGNTDMSGMKKASLEECCTRLLEILSDRGCLEDGEGALFTVREAEPGVHVDAERMAEEISVYAETFLKKKQAKGTVYVGAVTEAEEIMALAEEYATSVGKAAFVQNLIDKNTKVKAADGRRLCGLSVMELAGEIAEKKYNTSFIVVTAGRVYQVKEEETQAKTTAEEVTVEESRDTSGQAEGEAVSGTETSAEGSGGSEPGESEGQEGAETESEPGERPAEGQGPENGAAEGTSAASEGRQPGGTEPETQAPAVQPPAETQASAEAAPETHAPAPAKPAETENAVQPPVSTAPAETVPASRPAETQAPVVQPPTETSPAPETQPETTQAAETAAPPEASEPTSASGVLTPAGMPRHVGPGYVEEVVPIN